MDHEHGLVDHLGQPSDAMLPQGPSEEGMHPGARAARGQEAGQLRLLKGKGGDKTQWEWQSIVVWINKVCLSTSMRPGLILWHRMKHNDDVDEVDTAQCTDQ